MWYYEHSIETDAAPEAIYALYSDCRTWTSWDEGIQDLSLDGPFAAGTRGTITPTGQEALPFIIIETQPNVGFVDETEVSGLTIRFTHHLAKLENGKTRVTQTVSITGPGADVMGPKIGPMITNDMPKSMASLAQYALKSLV
ncbi:MAG TPA: SRPBCC family protein [Candidatus Baltobacteraceae bacterium]|nr:SRPBCC family protein [Candidatus Baltobacteraceae bacterium]